VTWLAGRRGVDYRNEAALVRIARGLRISFRPGRGGLTRTFVAGRDVTPELQSAAVARHTSASVASFPLVRRCLVERQRRFFTGRGLVAEGRDLGSVVFPDAPYKFYLTASFERRLSRRVAELREAGSRFSAAVLRRDLARRDREDRSRPGGALVAQADSWIIDNSDLNARETVAAMLRRIGRAAV